MSEPLSVLLIGGSPDDLRCIGEMLRECGRDVELTHCERSGDGLATVVRGGVDVVLLDFPGSGGVAAFDRLRLAVPDTPIIALTAGSDEHAAHDAMRRGAQDYLVRERVDAELLCRAIRYAVERTRVEVALRHSEAMYRRLVENLNEGVIAVDERGLITFANPRMEEMLGCSAGRLIGLQVAAFIAEPSPGRRNLFCRETDQRQEFETDFLAAGGGR
ncbi:MAG TPA: PAS domain S-box protein, partial [Methanoculleus sp.]|nr:PAS domain S-box protein [Methanoculleus sp.]